MSYSSRVRRQRNPNTHDEKKEENFFSKQHDIDHDKNNSKQSRPGPGKNEAGDSYENEANAVGSKIVSETTQSPSIQQKKMESVQRASVEPGKEKDKVQKKEEPEKEEEKINKKEESKKEEEKIHKKEEEKEKLQNKNESKEEDKKVQKKER